jgi:hypothetical protein
VISCVSVGFIPAAGSSNNNNRGHVAVARAISNRRLFAYDKLYAGWSQRYPINRCPKNPNRSSANAAISRSSRRIPGVRNTERRIPARVCPYAAAITFSFTDKFKNNRNV